MADVLKVKSQEISITTTPNTVFEARLVRVLNTGASSTLVVVRDSSNTILGSFTLSAYDKDGNNQIIMKEPTDTIQSNTGNAIVATSIAFY